MKPIVKDISTGHDRLTVCLGNNIEDKSYRKVVLIHQKEQSPTTITKSTPINFGEGHMDIQESDKLLD